jgi:hypothetical protein
MTETLNLYIVWAYDHTEDYMSFQAAFTDEALAHAFAAKLPDDQCSVEEKEVNAPWMVTFATSPLRRMIFLCDTKGEWSEDSFEELSDHFFLDHDWHVDDWHAEYRGYYVTLSAENEEAGLELAKTILKAHLEAAENEP